MKWFEWERMRLPQPHSAGVSRKPLSCGGLAESTGLAATALGTRLR